MSKKLGTFLTVLVFSTHYMASQELPYHEIPEYPSDYGPGNVVSRMIDGLGFRFYWATEGLTEKDWSYKPSESSRTVLETLQHIYGMSEMILNAPSATPNIRPADFSKLTFIELREKTLINLKAASEAMLDKQPKDFENFAVIFQSGDDQTSFPYWNLINGMLSDCIYHTGQITMLRRVTGNPFNSKASVFLGKLRNN